MFRNEKFSLYEVITLCISVIGLTSLVFLVVQTRQLSDTLESTVLTNLASRESEINGVFVEYPELQPYFFDGAEIDASNDDYARAVAVARLRVAFIGTIYEQSVYVADLNNENSPTWQAWKRYIRRSFSESPIMCQVLRETTDNYTPDFASFASEGCGS